MAYVIQARKSWLDELYVDGAEHTAKFWQICLIIFFTEKPEVKTIKLFSKDEKPQKTEKPQKPETPSEPAQPEPSADPASAAKAALEQSRKRRKIQPTITAGMINDYRADYAVKADKPAESENDLRKKKKKDEIKVSKASKNFDGGYTESSEYSTWVPPQGS